MPQKRVRLPLAVAQCHRQMTATLPIAAVDGANATSLAYYKVSSLALVGVHDDERK